MAQGGNAHTRQVLRLLPKQQFHVIVDAGCGAGCQTMVLAKELGTLIHAVDSYEPFLNNLMRYTKEARIERLVQTHCMDMKDIPGVFRSGYPEMQSIQQNIAIAEHAGYRVLTTYTIPKEAWVEGYYDILEPRAKALVDHPDPSVRGFAVETVKEIEIFECSGDSYGYVFYVLQRA